MLFLRWWRASHCMVSDETCAFRQCGTRLLPCRPTPTVWQLISVFKSTG